MENDDEDCGTALIVVEHYGLIPAVSVSVRLSGTCFQQVAVAVKSKQLCIELYKDLVLHRQIILGSASDMFVPSSCTNLCGDRIDLLLTCSRLHDFLLNVVHTDPGDNVPAVETSKSELPEKCDEEFPLEFSFRIQSSCNPYAINNGHIIDSLSRGSSPDEIVNAIYNSSIEENKLYSICCASCKQLLSRTPVAFKKVFFLPSNWTEVSESWFCHVRNCDDVPSSTPSPSINDLYITELYYLLSKSVIQNALCEPKSNMVKCDTCYAVIGTVKQPSQHFREQTVQCFKDMVLFRSEQPLAVISDYQSMCRKAVLFISALMRKNMQSSFTCKFCFESKKSASEGMCLFLWILDRRIHRFHLWEDLSKSDKFEEELKTGETLKVLYNSAEQASPLARTWLHDFSVDVYEISYSMMKSLLDGLKESSETVLRSQKMLNGLHVGFLPI